MEEDCELYFVQNNHSESKILFMEDRLPALVAVMEKKRLDNVELQLASWGYNTPIDKEMAMESERIRLMFSFLEEVKKYK